MGENIKNYFIKLLGGYTRFEVNRIESKYDKKINECKTAIDKFQELISKKDEIISSLNKEIDRLSIENQGYDTLLRTPSNGSFNTEPIRRRRRRRKPKKPTNTNIEE